VGDGARTFLSAVRPSIKSTLHFIKAAADRNVRAPSLTHF